MRLLATVSAALISSLSFAASAAAQPLYAKPFTKPVNTTACVFSSTFIPLDSSFATRTASAAGTLRKFPNGYRAIDKDRLSAVRTRCNNPGSATGSPSDAAQALFDKIYMGFIVNNYSDEPVLIDYLEYDIRNVAGQIVRASRIPPVARTVVKALKDAAILFLFVEPDGKGRRRFVGHRRAIPRNLGRRTVYYRIVGHSRGRERIVTRHKNTIGFRDVKGCDS